MSHLFANIPLCVCILPIKLQNIRRILIVCSLFIKGWHANLAFSQQSLIRKFLGSFSYRKVANFSSLPVRKSQFRKFLRCASPLTTNPQIIRHKTEGSKHLGHLFLKSSASFRPFQCKAT
jgi:hypothetical protein